MIPGIDVSHWQGDIDWLKVAQCGVKFAFIKATEFPDKKTTVYIDDKLKKNVAGAIQNGVVWGAYHYFRTHIDPVIQARTFCETVGQFNSLPPVLDLEVAGCNGAKLNEKVISFIKEVERITNRQPIIYTSGGFWRGYMMYNRRTDTDWASPYTLWLAQYTATWPTVIYPWAGYDFWQYSDKGRIPGIATGVDLDWYMGTLEEIQQRFIGTKISKTYTDLTDSRNLDPVTEKDNPINENLMKKSSPKLAPDQTEQESDDSWIKRYFFNR